MDGAAKPFVGAATAYIRDPGVDVGVGRIGISLEERRRGHDLSGLAVAALRHVLCQPSLLHRVLAVGRKPLDCGNASTLERPDRHRAGAHRLSVDVDRAGATLRNATTELGA